MNKFLKYRIHWSISVIILLSVALFSAYQVNVKAAGKSVFAGRITAQIPMATCSNQYTCSACTLCGCGQWDENIIAPIFGTVASSKFYACKMSSFQPAGQAGLVPGATVFGDCGSTQFSTYSPESCNIWAQMQ